jgi:hypothetical protein
LEVDVVTFVNARLSASTNGRRSHHLAPIAALILVVRGTAFVELYVDYVVWN